MEKFGRHMPKHEIQDYLQEKEEALDHWKSTAQLWMEEERRSYEMEGFLDKLSDEETYHFALELINNGHATDVFFNMELFQVISQYTLFQAAIQHEEFEAIAVFADNFDELKSEQIATDLINAGAAAVLADHLLRFHRLPESLAERLIGMGYAEEVMEHLDSFRDVNKERLLRRLLAAGRQETRAAAVHFDQLDNLTNPAPVISLIQMGYGAEVAKNFLSPAISEKVALALVKNGNAKELAGSIDRFSKLNSEIAHALVSDGFAGDVAHHLWCFRELDFSMAKELIKAGYGEQVALTPFPFRARKSELAEYLLRAGQADVILSYRSVHGDWKDMGVPLEKIVDICVKTGQMAAVADYLDLYLGRLQPSLAEALTAAGFVENVWKQRHRYLSLDWEKLAAISLDKGTGKEIADVLSMGTVWQHTESNLVFSERMTRRFISAGHEVLVLAYPECFAQVDNQMLIRNLLEKKQFAVIASHLLTMKGLDISVAEILIKNGYTGDVVDAIKSFTTPEAVASLLVNVEQYETLAHQLHMFPNVPASVIHTLIAKGQGAEVTNNAEALRQLDVTAVNMLVDEGRHDVLLTVRGGSLFRTQATEAKMRQLIESGNISLIRSYLFLFHRLSLETAEKLISLGAGTEVANNSHVFADIEDLGQLLFQRGEYFALTRMFNRLKSVTPAAVAEAMIAAGETQKLVRWLDYFSNLDISVVKRLLQTTGGGDAVMRQPHVFALYRADPRAFYNQVAQIMLEEQPSILVGQLYRFIGLGNDIAEVMIARGLQKTMINHISAFERIKLDHISFRHLSVQRAEILKAALGRIDADVADKAKIIALILDKVPLKNYAMEREKMCTTNTDVPADRIRGTWHDSIKKMEGLQARVANAKYDPWITDLDPLLRNAEQSIPDLGSPLRTLIDRSNTQDGEYVAEFVQQYGMFNLPILFQTHVELRRAADWKQLPAQTRSRLASVGVQLKTEGALLPADKAKIDRDLLAVMVSLRAEILEDKIPKLLLDRNCEIALELFNILKGQTQWSRLDRPADIIAELARTAKEQPHLAVLPPGYEELTFSVPLRGVKTAEAGEPQEKTHPSLVKKENLALVDGLGSLFQLGQSIGDPAEWWKGKQAALITGYQKDISDIEAKIKSGTAPEKALVAMEKRKSGLEELVGMVAAIQIDLEQNTAIRGSDLLGALVEIRRRDTKVLLPLIKELSAGHLLSIMPDGMKQKIVSLVEKHNMGDRAALDEEELTGWASFMTDYLGEHYLHPQQDQHHTGHPPFTPQTLDTLKNLWEMNQGAPKHPLVKEANDLRASAESGGKKLGKTLEVTLVPSKGVLRVYSGDLGDACFTSKHRELASGGYPGLTSFTFVTGRGTKQERLRGSVLVIETKTMKNEPVLLVRANNPQENLLGQVDTESLLDAVMEQMADLAKKRKIAIMAVPVDEASASCSNRSQVAQYYQDRFRKNEALRLVDTPETNFNGYNNWDPRGDFPVRATNL